MLGRLWQPGPRQSSASAPWGAPSTQQAEASQLGRARHCVGSSSTASGWESHVDGLSFPTDWRVEPLPPSLRGFGTLGQGRAAWEAGTPVCGTPSPARGWSLDSELRAPLLLAETHSLDFPSDLLYSTGWPSGPLFACPYNGRVVSFGEDEGIIRTVRFQG